MEDFSPSRIKWTKDACYTVAKECITLKEFSTKYPSACVRARKQGWIQDYTWLKKTIRRPHGYWKDFNKCYDIAKEYTSKKDFREKSPECYTASINYGFIKNFTWLRDQRIDLYNGKVDTIYVYEFLDKNSAYIGRTLSNRVKERDWEHIYIENDTVARFAKKYSIPVPEMKILEINLTLDESVVREGDWIEIYRKNGWNILNKIKAGGLGKIGKYKAKYTYEYCLSLAKQCKTLYEFRKLDKGVPYITAKEHKWTDEYTWLIRQTKENGYWTEETCKEAALQCKNRAEFGKKFSRAYYIANINNWLDEYTWLNYKSVKKNGYWTKEKCREAALKCNTRMEFRKKYISAYNSARKNNWLDSYTWFQNGYKLNAEKRKNENA